MPATTYTLDELDEFEELAAQANVLHLRSARLYILGLCEAANVGVGILGGYSLLLRGSSRPTTDIDIYFAVSMAQLRAIVSNGDRVIRPSSNLADAVYKIFVRTAGGWDDVGGNEQIVEVDAMPQGGLAGGTIEFIHADGQQIPVLDIPSMLRAKFRSFNDRQARNDLYDIRWLIDNYPDIVSAQRNNIDYVFRELFVQALDDVDMTTENRIRYKQALGVTWPPDE